MTVTTRDYWYGVATPLAVAGAYIVFWQTLSDRVLVALGMIEAER